MGTDIHICAEARKNNQWVEVKVDFKDNHMRNSILFTILAGLENDFVEWTPISEIKGLPDDISEDVKEELKTEDRYGYSYYTLKELRDYDWNQSLILFGIINEKQYVKLKESGEYPKQWRARIHGEGIIVIDSETMDKILGGYISRTPGVSYYVKAEFPAKTCRACCLKFYEDMISLETLIPKGGTDEDIRIIFAFD